MGSGRSGTETTVPSCPLHLTDPQREHVCSGPRITQDVRTKAIYHSNAYSPNTARANRRRGILPHCGDSHDRPHLRTGPCECSPMLLYPPFLIIMQPPRPSEGAVPHRTSEVKSAGPSASAYTTQAHNPTANTNQYANLPPLERQIVTFMRSQPPNEEGIHVAAIARHVASVGSAGDAHGIRYLIPPTIVQSVIAKHPQTVRLWIDSWTMVLSIPRLTSPTSRYLSRQSKTGSDICCHIICLAMSCA